MSKSALLTSVGRGVWPGISVRCSSQQGAKSPSTFISGAAKSFPRLIKKSPSDDSPSMELVMMISSPRPCRVSRP